MQSVINAIDFLNFAKDKAISLLDVRAEVEFARGALPNSVNIPILTTEERHLVGISYKQQGREAAILLGQELVNETKRTTRVQAWKTFLQNQSTPFLTCFRGGMRSRYAQEWLAADGLPCTRITGGYKALRHELLKQISLPRKGIILSGLTGTGKTSLLQSLASTRVIDLEKFAAHRGSAFGSSMDIPQPAQQTFENSLGFALLKNPLDATLLFESESRLIGKNVIREDFFEQLRTMPRVELIASMDLRTNNLFKEYVTGTLEKHSSAEIFSYYAKALHSIRNRLGGKDHDSIFGQMQIAFARSATWENHRSWIESLLVRYYDPLYQHAQSRRNGEISFEGSAEEIREWLRERQGF